MKVGDLVNAVSFGKVATVSTAGPVYSGVIVDIEEVTDLFSEKYAITEVNTYVRVLCNGEIKSFDLNEDLVEVISESR